MSSASERKSLLSAPLSRTARVQAAGPGGLSASLSCVGIRLYCEDEAAGLGRSRRLTGSSKGKSGRRASRKSRKSGRMGSSSRTGPECAARNQSCPSAISLPSMTAVVSLLPPLLHPQPDRNPAPLPLLLPARPNASAVSDGRRDAVRAFDACRAQLEIQQTLTLITRAGCPLSFPRSLWT